jgi:hypothetical protein
LVSEQVCSRWKNFSVERNPQHPRTPIQKLQKGKETHRRCRQSAPPPAAPVPLDSREHPEEARGRRTRAVHSPPPKGKNPLRGQSARRRSPARSTVRRGRRRKVPGGSASQHPPLGSEQNKVWKREEEGRHGGGARRPLPTARRPRAPSPVVGLLCRHRERGRGGRRRRRRGAHLRRLSSPSPTGHRPTRSASRQPPSGVTASGSGGEWGQGLTVPVQGSFVLARVALDRRI